MSHVIWNETVKHKFVNNHRTQIKLEQISGDYLTASAIDIAINMNLYTTSDGKNYETYCCRWQAECGYVFLNVNYMCYFSVEEVVDT